MIESLRLIKASSMADRSLLTVNVNGRPDDIITVRPPRCVLRVPDAR